VAGVPALRQGPLQGRAAVLFLLGARGLCGVWRVGLTACERCQAEPQVDLAAQRAAVKAGRRRSERSTSSWAGRCASPSAHFVLTFDIEKIDLGKPHLALHVYLDRLEAFMERFQKDLGRRTPISRRRRACCCGRARRIRPRPRRVHAPAVDHRSRS